MKILLQNAIKVSLRRPWGPGLICVSHFKFSESAFLDNKINVNHMVKKHCFNMRIDNRLSIARFMHESISLRDMVGRHGN